MEIKDDITRRKIELTIEVLRAALQGKDIEINSYSDKGQIKLDNIGIICPDIIGSAIIAFNYKIILKDKTNHTRTIKQTENIIKTIMILTEWLNGKDIAFRSEKRDKLVKCVSVPLITTWSCDKYEVLFNN